jgi:hypothetical protein
MINWLRSRLSGTAFPGNFNCIYLPGKNGTGKIQQSLNIKVTLILPEPSEPSQVIVTNTEAEHHLM